MKKILLKIGECVLTVILIAVLLLVISIPFLCSF
jgi:hypothetical protein